jgi:hypothetical protein
MKATYVGEGEYLNGVPARDLSTEDWDALTPDLQVEVVASGLYEFEGGDPEPAAAADEPSAEPVTEEGR